MALNQPDPDPDNNTFWGRSDDELQDRPYGNLANPLAPHVRGAAAEEADKIGTFGAQLRADKQTGWLDSFKRGVGLTGGQTMLTTSATQVAFQDWGTAPRIFDTSGEGHYDFKNQTWSEPSSRASWTDYVQSGTLAIMEERGVDITPDDTQTFRHWKLKVQETAARMAATDMADQDGSLSAGVAAGVANALTEPTMLFSFGSLAALSASAKVGRVGIAAAHKARYGSLIGMRRSPKLMQALDTLRTMEHAPLAGLSRGLGGQVGSTGRGLVGLTMAESVLYASAANGLEESSFDSTASATDFVVVPGMAALSLTVMNGLMSKAVPAAGRQLVKAIDRVSDGSGSGLAGNIRRDFVGHQLGNGKLAQIEAEQGELTTKAVIDFMEETMSVTVVDREGFAAKVNNYLQDGHTDPSVPQMVRLRQLRDFTAQNPSMDEWHKFFAGKMVSKQGKLTTTTYQRLVTLIDKDNLVLIARAQTPLEVSEDTANQAVARIAKNMRRLRRLTDITVDTPGPTVQTLSAPSVALLPLKDRRVYISGDVHAMHEKVLGVLDKLYFSESRVGMNDVIDTMIDGKMFRRHSVKHPIIRILRSGVLGQIGGFGTGNSPLRKLEKMVVEDERFEIFVKLADLVDPTSEVQEAFNRGDLARRSLFRAAQASTIDSDGAIKGWDNAVTSSVRGGADELKVRRDMMRALAGADVDLTDEAAQAVEFTRTWLNKSYNKGVQARLTGNQVDNYIPIQLLSSASDAKNASVLGTRLHKYWQHKVYGTVDDMGNVTHAGTLASLGWVRLTNGRVDGIADVERFIGDLPEILKTNALDGGPKGIRPENIRPEHREEYFEHLAMDNGVLYKEARQSIARRVGGGNNAEDNLVPDARMSLEDVDSRMIDSRISIAQRRKIDQEFWLQDDLIEFVDVDQSGVFSNYQQRYNIPIAAAQEVQAAFGISGLTMQDLIAYGKTRAGQFNDPAEAAVARAVMGRIEEVYSQGVLNVKPKADTVGKQVQKILTPMQGVIRAQVSTVGATVALVEVPMSIAKEMLTGGLDKPLRQIVTAMIRAMSADVRIEDAASWGELWGHIAAYSRIAGQLGDDPRSLNGAGSLKRRAGEVGRLAKDGWSKNGSIGPAGELYSDGGVANRVGKGINGMIQAGNLVTRTLSLEEFFTGMSRNITKVGTLSRLHMDINENVLDRLAKLQDIPEHINAMPTGKAREKAYQKWVRGIARESGALDRGSLRAGNFRVQDYAKYGLLEPDTLKGGRLLMEAAPTALSEADPKAAWAAISLMNPRDAIKAEKFFKATLTMSTDLADKTSFRARPWTRLGGTTGSMNDLLFNLMSYSSGFYNQVLPRMGDEGTAFAAAILPVYIVGEFMQEFVRDMTVRGGERREQWEKWANGGGEGDILQSRFVEVAGRINVLGPMGSFMSAMAMSQLPGARSFTPSGAIPGVSIADGIYRKFASALDAATNPDSDASFTGEGVDFLSTMPGLNNFFLRGAATEAIQHTDEDSLMGTIMRNIP